MADKINPEHYKRGGLETIDIMKKKLTPEEYIGKMKGDQYKYLERRGYKETEGLSELQWNENCAVECRKQMWYTEKELTPEEYIGKMKGDQYKYLERRGYKETEGLSELQWNENCAVECRKQMWYTEKELNVYLENIAAIKAKVQSDEWIDDPLHDED